MAAAILRGKSITAIYSSGLRRARDTAEALAQSLGLPMTIIAAPAERRWGELEGKPRAWRVPGLTPPGAETKDESEKRIRYALRQIKPGGLPLIVAHSGVYRVLCSILGILDPETRLRPTGIRPAGVDGTANRHRTGECRRFVSFSLARLSPARSGQRLPARTIARARLPGTLIDPNS
jgi:broad specificity phosphatase PhoE